MDPLTTLIVIGGLFSIVIGALFGLYGLVGIIRDIPDNWRATAPNDTLVDAEPDEQDNRP